MDAHLILEACEIIGALTPLAGDCGVLCGAACCQPDEDGQGGMSSFPEKGPSWPGKAGAASLPPPGRETCSPALPPVPGKSGLWPAESSR